MPATLRSEAAPAASAFLPTGPAAIDTFPPSVSDPAWEKVFTALASLRINTKSVSSNPIWPPKPAPPVAMADGALQLPSGRRATTRPLPKRADPRNPALITVRIARPWVEKTVSHRRPSPGAFRQASPLHCPHTFAFASTEGGMIFSGPRGWRGSTKEVRILPHFLHSAGDTNSSVSVYREVPVVAGTVLTRQG